MKTFVDARTSTSFCRLRGGEDLISPVLDVDPGRALLANNYELDLDGNFKLTDGYEVFDGQPKPSEAVYYLLNFDAGELEIEVGNILDGAGGASAEVLIVELESGAWATSDASGYVILFNKTGTYVDDEELTVSSVRVADVNGNAQLNGGADDDTILEYTLAVREALRADIAAVPGSGSILGVWQYGGVVYAFRNNPGGTIAQMYKSSTSGWTLCNLGEWIDFTSGGTYEIQEGDTITGHTSSVTAIVGRIILSSGTFADGDAAGRMFIRNVSGAFQAETLDVGANVDVATIAGDSTAISLSPGGVYEFVNYNFGGNTGQRRMYGVDGENKAFEWDGTTFVQIATGMTTDTPTHLAAHKGRLFLSYSGGSVQYSSLPADVDDPVFPYVWDVLTGAGELGIGDEITGFVSMPDVLAIFARGSTTLLYGTSVDDFQLKTHSQESGAIARTVQRLGDAVYLGDRGITSLGASDTYGDFKASAAMSKYIDPLIPDIISNTLFTLPVKAKNQYRIMLNNLTAVTMTFDSQKVIGFTRQQYKDQFTCASSTESSTGEEELFAGCENGYVYQLDKGTSLNGENINALIRLHFNHLKSPHIIKRIKKIVMHLKAPVNCSLSAVLDFNYAESSFMPPALDIDDPGDIWGIGVWGEFVWGGRAAASPAIYINGSCQNFNLTLIYSSLSAAPHTLHGYYVTYINRRERR